MFLDKKGDSETIVALFAFLIVVAILFFYGSTLIDVLTGRTDSSNCNTWVSIQSKSKIAGIVAIPRDSPCITEINTLTDKKENEFYDYMAKSAFSCWDMYGRGEVDFFSDWDFSSIDNKYCFVCEEAAIGENVDVIGFDRDKFEVYLSNNHPSGNKNSYADLFTGAENSRIDFGEGNIPLKKGDKLYTIFSIFKTNTPPSATQYIEDTLSFTGISTAFIYPSLQVISGSGYFYPGLYVVNSNDLSSIGCSSGGIHFKPKKELISKENLT